MSGFGADKLNAEFFLDGKWRVNLLCNLGYGDQIKLYPRNPAWSLRKPQSFCRDRNATRTGISDSSKSIDH
jgi:hypothetical protein